MILIRDNDKLKPCPFCGNKVRLAVNVDATPNIYFIRCDNCLAGLGSECWNVSSVRGNLYFDNEQDIIDAWNSRADLQKC